MTKQTLGSGDNVVSLAAKAPDGRGAPAKTLAAAGSPEDPRMKEALRLMQAFLAIEDAPGRAALITLAERLVGDEWARKQRQR